MYNYNLVFFGRLTNVKRIDLAIEAVIQLNRKFQKFSLKVVGDGPQEEYLKKIVCDADANEYISFERAKYSEYEIGQMFFQSDLLISPGNVGLNAVHAMFYGTPVLTHNNFNNQMPESEIIEEGVNGVFHKENDLKSIEDKIEQWFSFNFNSWNRDKIRKRLIKKYNPIYQAKIFERALLQNN